MSQGSNISQGIANSIPLPNLLPPEIKKNITGLFVAGVAVEVPFSSLNDGRGSGFQPEEEQMKEEEDSWTFCRLPWVLSIVLTSVYCSSWTLPPITLNTLTVHPANRGYRAIEDSNPANRAYFTHVRQPTLNGWLSLSHAILTTLRWAGRTNRRPSAGHGLSSPTTYMASHFKNQESTGLITKDLERGQ